MRWWPWAAGVGILVVAAVAGVALFGDDDPPPDTVPDSVTLPDPAAAGLDAGGAELVGLLEAGRAATYHATYAVIGGDLGGESSIEVWRADGRVRQDTLLIADDGTEVRTAGIQVDGATVSCTKQGDQPWACSTAETSTAGDAFGAVETQLLGVDVVARNDDVDGRPARCFEFATADGPGSACVSPEGVMLLLALGESEIRLDDLGDDVADDVFVPPAEPVG